MHMPYQTPLARLLADRCGGRFFKMHAELASRLPNSYCRLEAIDQRVVTIRGRRLVNFNAINYLGLESHPAMIEAAHREQPGE